MTVEVKICGVRTPAILDAATAAGADFVGFVFFQKSPRNLTPENAQGLAAAARGRAKTVAVMVDPDDALIDAVAAEVQPDFLQLHGSETPERVAAMEHRLKSRADEHAARHAELLETAEPTAPRPTEVPEAVREGLRALGYLDAEQDPDP